MLCEKFKFIYYHVPIKTVREQYGEALLDPNLRDFSYFYCKTSLLVVFRELVSVSVARFSCYGRKINMLERRRLQVLEKPRSEQNLEIRARR